jgi:hypothetical protein
VMWTVAMLSFRNRDSDFSFHRVKNAIESRGEFYFASELTIG